MYMPGYISKENSNKDNSNIKNNNKNENKKIKDNDNKKEKDEKNKDKKSNSNYVNKNKESKSKREEESKVEISSFKCKVKSIDKKENSITVLRSNNKSFKVYLEKNTKIENMRGKNIKINDLKEGKGISISMEYKNNKFVASSIKVTDK